MLRGWGGGTAVGAHPCPSPTAPSMVPPAPQGRAQPGSPSPPPSWGYPFSRHQPGLALATFCGCSCNTLCPAQRGDGWGPPDHLGLVCAPAPSLPIQPGGTAGILPPGPFFLEFARLLLFSAAPDVEGSGRGEIKKPLKQTNTRRRRGRACAKPRRFLASACGRGGLSRGWTLHNPPSCSPRQSPACTAVKASVSLRELGLAHPSRSPRLRFLPP